MFVQAAKERCAKSFPYSLRSSFSNGRARHSNQIYLKLKFYLQIALHFLQ